MAKKDKKKKDDEPAPAEALEEVQVAATDLEPEPEEVQFTETSYTSASFETLPPPPEEPKHKPKKKKKKATSEIVIKGSELFQWSEESLPVFEEEKIKEESPVGLAQLPKRKDKKEKKGKKGKKEKKEEEIPDFEKPKSWKKMNKKERDLWLAERIEQWRQEQEAARQAALAGAKEKRAALARERAELMAKDVAEQEVRRDILEKTCTLFQRYEKEKLDYDNRKQIKAEWSQYLRCDGLPDPRIVTQMSTYLHMWKERAVYDADELDKKCTEVLPMLEMLEEFVANSRQYTEMQAQNYNEVRLQLRAQLAYAIEFASYTLLRDIETHLKMESIKLSTYQRQFSGLKLTLWVAIKMPTRKPKPVEPEPLPIELAFPALHVALKLPKSLGHLYLCVRASRSMLDLLSESSRSFALANDMPNRYEDLFIFNVKELAEVQKIKKEQDAVRSAFYKLVRERTKELEQFFKTNIYAKADDEKEELEELYLAEPPFMPDPRTFIATENEKRFRRYLKVCNVRTRTGEVNLRKYRICGGVLNLDLLVTPPQPKRMRFEVALSTCEYIHT